MTTTAISKTAMKEKLSMVRLWIPLKLQRRNQEMSYQDWFPPKTRTQRATNLQMWSPSQTWIPCSRNHPIQEMKILPMSGRSSLSRMSLSLRRSLVTVSTLILRIMRIRFQALLRYLYTNEIEFAPWGSAERRGARAQEPMSESYGIPKPSPKSIYRLADKVAIKHQYPFKLGLMPHSTKSPS